MPRKPERKPKPRCANCGDETSFPENTVAGREEKGFCVPCWHRLQDFVPFNKPAKDGRQGYWLGENRSLYAKKPFDSAGRPRREED